MTNKRLFVRQMNQPAKLLPKTIEQAVDRLISEMSLKEKSRIERMDERDLMDLYFTLSVDIEDKFRIFENEALLESCRTLSEDMDFFAEEASLIIIVELWKRLQTLYKERDVDL